MEYRNAKRTAAGLIDCEINHPDLGWIPFTADPSDTGAPFDVAALVARIEKAGSIAEYVPPAVTAADINAERARRIMTGTDIILSDGTIIGMQGRTEDQMNLTTQKDIAQYLIANGQADTTVIWRDSHNTLHKLKPAQMIEVWLKSAAHVSAIYEASWALKAMDPIPDVSDSKLWPK